MRKGLSIFLTILMFLGMFPLSVFAMSIEDLNIGTIPQGGKEIKLKDLHLSIVNGGQEITGAMVVDPHKNTELKVSFTLPDIPIGEDGEPDFTQPSATNVGDFMTITLPALMKFDKKQTVTMPMTAGGQSGLEMGELTVNGNTAVLVFGKDAANPEYLDRGGKFEASVSIDWNITETEEKEVLFNIFGNEYTVVVKPPVVEEKIDLKKSGTADLSAGKILWTIKLTPTKEDMTYDGFFFSDMLPDSVIYLDGTFALNGEKVESGADYNEKTGELSYQFPDGITGSQIVTFETSIKDLASKNGKEISIENTASIANPSTGAFSSDSTVVKFTPKWLGKSGTYDSATHSVTWIIKVNESKAVLKDVVVTDELTEGLTLLENKAITVNGKALSEGIEGAAKPYYTLKGNTVKFHLGDISSMQTIEFTTKLDNSVKPTVKNTAVVHWTDEGSSIIGGGDGAGATGSTDTSIGHGYIAKSAGNYDFTNNVMPWSIEVNSAGQQVEDARVIEIFAYKTDGKGNPTGEATGTIKNKDRLGEYKDYAVSTNQRYLEGSLSLSSGSVQKLADSGTFTKKGQYKLKTVDLGSNIEAQVLELYLGTLSNTTERISLNVELTDKNAYGVNGRSTAYAVRNEAYLHTTNGEVSSVAEAKIKRHIIEKTVAEGYNYKDRTITWKLHVNHNGIKIDNGVISDTLPAYWTVDGETAEDFLVIYKGQKAAVNSNNPQITPEGEPLTGAELGKLLKQVTVSEPNKSNIRTVTIKLNHIEDPYVILLKTKLPQEGADKLLQVNGNINVRNTAAMNGSAIVGNPSDYEDATIKNNLLSKSGQLEADRPGDILWTINVNQNGIQLPMKEDMDEVRIVDRLIDALTPKKSAAGYDVTIWEMQRDAQGKMIRGQKLDNADVQKGIEYDAKSNTLYISLPNSGKPYQIELVTSIVDDTVSEVTNKVEMQGISTTVNSTQTGTQSVKLAANAWGSLAGKIILTKTDADTAKLLAGAEFKLYETTEDHGKLIKNEKHKYIKKTNAKGELEFKYLPAGTYWLEESTPPTGYMLNAEPGRAVILTKDGQNKIINVEISIANKALAGAAQIKKTDDAGKDLAGAVFGLYKGALSANPYGTAVSDNNGSVTFNNLKQGTYFIKEIKAPDGYRMSAEKPVKVVVDADGKVSYSRNGTAFEDGAVPTVSNAAYKAQIAVLKVNKEKQPLAGATFTLYDRNGQVVKTAVSRDDGYALFKNIPYGKYTVKETAAPEGYQLNLAPAEIAERDFSLNGTVSDVRILIKVTDEVIVADKDDSNNGGSDGDNNGGDDGDNNGGSGGDNNGGDDGDNNGGSGGSSGGSSGGGGSYEPPVVEIEDPETPLAGFEDVVPETAAVPEEMPAIPEPLFELDDEGLPLGQREGALPKTGGLAAELFFGAGAAFAAIGGLLKKVSKKAK